MRSDQPLPQWSSVPADELPAALRPGAAATTSAGPSSPQSPKPVPAAGGAPRRKAYAAANGVRDPRIGLGFDAGVAGNDRDAGGVSGGPSSSGRALGGRGGGGGGSGAGGGGVSVKLEPGLGGGGVMGHVGATDVEVGMLARPSCAMPHCSPDCAMLGHNTAQDP